MFKLTPQPLTRSWGSLTLQFFQDTCFYLSKKKPQWHFISSFGEQAVHLKRFDNENVFCGFYICIDKIFSLQREKWYNLKIAVKYHSVDHVERGSFLNFTERTESTSLLRAVFSVNWKGHTKNAELHYDIYSSWILLKKHMHIIKLDTTKQQKTKQSKKKDFTMILLYQPFF